ncbi:putative monooxygenase/flavin reductase-like, FMN-binding [Bradyrhizobium sp. ORS 278]|uniref:flavin reductase family protein n=1 Tax=Bradyrhizobium sp. (strain ORS 278) TaxID=114615 RepID=UPI0001508E6F|nr:flavin reductase family protein [Bradyrhizobium sp. ORS 278]CAL78023.1 putative monooxygenase/flavin reductase-like, FMN-binding [Bradyrhizobium sp. ORS 278]
MSKHGLHLLTASTPLHFSSALRRVAAGVSIVTAGHGDDITGVTTASLVSLSVEPPRLMINLGRQSSAFPLIARDGWFGINVLSSDQLALADRFSSPHLVGRQKFDGIEWSRHAAGVPLLQHAQAAIACEVDEIIERYDHAIIVGRPDTIELAPRLSSLLYWNEQYVEVDRNADLDLLAEVGVPPAHVR